MEKERRPKSRRVLFSVVVVILLATLVVVGAASLASRGPGLGTPEFPLTIAFGVPAFVECYQGGICLNSTVTYHPGPVLNVTISASFENASTGANITLIEGGGSAQGICTLVYTTNNCYTRVPFVDGNGNATYRAMALVLANDGRSRLSEEATGILYLAPQSKIISEGMGCPVQTNCQELGG